MRTFSNTYVVIRTTEEWDSSSDFSYYVKPIVLGVFKTHDAADSFAGAEAQRMIDKGYPSDKYKFQVELGTYYDD